MSVRILFLYARLNGFVLSTLRSLDRRPEVASVDVVYWNQAADIGNKYVPDTGGTAIRLHPRSETSRDDLDRLLAELRPDIIYISGWMDRMYLSRLLAYRRRTRGVVTICGFDDQWFGTARQLLAATLLRPFIPRIFDVAWVSGAPQYHYARRLGFRHERIVFNLLSADSGKCPAAGVIEHRFLFIGRMDRVKGLEILIEAHRTSGLSWPLTLIGDGVLRDALGRQAGKGVEFLPYLQPDELARQLARGGVGVLPSRFESWGVSLHEMALSGLPLIASSRVGAASEFLIDGYNGRLVRPDDVADLRAAMIDLATASDERRAQMGLASRDLGQRISPELAAASLLASRRHSEL